MIDLPDRRDLRGRRRRPALCRWRSAFRCCPARCAAFPGFGSALIYVPLMSALYEPRIGAASFLLIDFVTGIVLLDRRAGALAVWREVVPLALAGASSRRRSAR